MRLNDKPFMRTCYIIYRMVEDYGLHIQLWEDIMDHVGSVNCAWERTAFEEVVKTGIRLMMEVGET